MNISFLSGSDPDARDKGGAEGGCSRKYARKMQNVQLPSGGRGSGRQPRKVDSGRGYFFFTP